MNKTIISICGGANRGKSATIKETCKMLIANFPNAISLVTNIDYDDDILLAIQLGEVKIGIESQGDPNGRMILKDTIRKLADKKFDHKLGGCDIIICSTRTSGKTAEKVGDIANKYDYNIIWISSLYCRPLNHDVLNRMAGLNIIELIKSLIVEQL